MQSLNVVLAVAFGLTLSGCSNMLSPSKPAASFDSTDAQTLAKHFAKGAFNGVNAGNQMSTRAVPVTPMAPGALWAQPQAVTCNSSGSSCQLYQQYSQTTNCSSGGRVSAVGSLSGFVSVNSFGAIGTVSLQQTTSIVDWTCDGGWTANGDPYISDLGTLTLNSSRTSFSFHESGGFVAVATSGGTRVSCQESVNVLWDNLTAGTLSGTVTCVPGGTFNVSGSF